MENFDLHKEWPPSRSYSLGIAAVSSTRREADLLEKTFFANQHKLLELGCGYGRICKELARRGKTISGIDIVESNIAFAKSNAGNLSIDYLVADMQSLPFADHEFGGVFSMLGSFHYLVTETAQTKAFAEAYRVLQPGGKLLISVDHNSLPAFLAPLIVDLMACYTQEQLAQLAQNAGFKDIHFSTMRMGYLLNKKRNLFAVK